MQKKLLSIFMAALLVLTLMPTVYAAPSNSQAAVWDGKSIDVSWYNTTDKTLYISTPVQLAGLAAIVNGIYNTGITQVTGDASVIRDNTSTTGSGTNNKSTDTYHYGSDTFSGRTICLTADLDMGGVYNAASDTWSGPDYMPVGGQYLMTQNDSSTKLGSSFCGVFDGQGHTVYNIYCNRRCTSGNFGDGASIGFVGRLGVHDNDDSSLRPVDPTVKNLTVTGYIYGNRSIGGIVGKIGKTSVNNGDGSTGGIIENCANFATVSNTDAKGCGGICGASWNGGIIRNCYNAGNVSTIYNCPTAGIAGSNEITIENCYNVGTISATDPSFAMALGTNNGGAPYSHAVYNCWYLDGSATGGGYFSNNIITNDGKMSASQMRSAAFLTTLGSAFTADSYGINDGYPILRVQAENAARVAAQPAGYRDVSSTSWYYSYVSFVTEKGYFDSVATGQFGPDQPMTRAMLVTALYRMAGSPAVTGTTAFADVPGSASYASAVLWASQNGVVNGMSQTEFAPDASITREQIATMFARYAAYKGMNTASSASLAAFGDSGQISQYATAAVRWAVGAGLINGMTPETIAPQGTATRAQVAAMVERFASL